MAVVKAALASCICLQAIAYLSKLHGFAVPSIKLEIESKGVQFPGRDAPAKISGSSLFAVAPDTSKICGFVPQEQQQ